MKVKAVSRVQPLATPWTAPHQAPPSMGFVKPSLSDEIIAYGERRSRMKLEKRAEDRVLVSHRLEAGLGEEEEEGRKPRG